jgi:hypothetical protein
MSRGDHHVLNTEDCVASSLFATVFNAYYCKGSCSHSVYKLARSSSGEGTDHVVEERLSVGVEIARSMSR